MPLLLGLFLVALFIWFAENFGTLTKTWLYPSQMNGWVMVPFAKLSSWLLLMTISYVMVAWVNKPQAYDPKRDPERRYSSRCSHCLARPPGSPAPRAPPSASPPRRSRHR